jgi:hypothetical protein
MGIGAVADRRSRQQHNSQHKSEPKPDPDAQDGSESSARRPNAQHDGTAPLPDATIPAETLFTTTLMAIEMLPSTLSPNEVKLRNSHNWLPPYSALRLKDKLI